MCPKCTVSDLTVPIPNPDGPKLVLRWEVDHKNAVVLVMEAEWLKREKVEKDNR